MASGTILDSFLVQVGLDPRGFEAGRRRLSDDMRRVRDDAERMGGRVEGVAKKATAGLSTMRGEVLRLGLAFLGAASITSFATNVVSTSAGVGRLADNLGMATEEVGAWGSAIKKVGGQAADAENTLRLLKKAFFDYQLTGTTGMDADLRAFGITGEDLEDPTKALMKLAQAAETMGQAEFSARLTRMGISESMITLLAKGRSGVEELREEYKRLHPNAEQNAEDAQEMQEKLAKMREEIEAKLIPIVFKFVELLDKFLDDQDAVNGALVVGAGAIGALGIAAGIAYGPLIALGAALAYIVANREKLAQMANDDWFNFREDDQSFTDKVAQGAKDMWNEPWFTMRKGEPDFGGIDPFLGLGKGGGSGRGVGGRTPEAVDKYFRSKGLSPEQAAGVTASVVAEGGLNKRLGGGYRGRAIGIGQLLGSRRKKFLDRYGDNFTLQDELDFMLEEMGNADGQYVGRKIRGMNSSSDIAKLMVDDFYRPAKGAETQGDYDRASRYLRGRGGASSTIRAAQNRGGGSSGTTISINSVTVQSNATSAKQLGNDLERNVARRATAQQMNGGLS